MIDRGALLADLQKLVTELENDLRDRCEEHAPTAERLTAEHRKARDAGRTAHDFTTWREDLITQAAVAWVLACVFVRFVEDNGLIETPRLSGPGPSLQRARDEHTHYFQQHPTETDREYLLYVFREAARLPAMGPLYDEAHNPLFRVGLSADGATKLLEFWQRIDPDSGALAHDFSDPTWDTRFLGDLYQDLSAAARKKYALLQTPDFVESFILDRTLDPAIEEFGLATVSLIDPACGSGHFLLGAFDRVFKRWQAAEPGTNPRALAQRALDVVHGVDLNPFAVSIARFRLLLAAAKACGITRLSQSPAFTIHLAAGDSLFHGRRPGRDDRETYLIPEADPLKHVYTGEDEGAIKALLERRYHVVVGNPPYIVPNDAALNAEYRAKYGSCYRQYSLGVPFTERFFDLALSPEEGSDGAGFIGTITANSFMKREFGRRLVEHFIPRWDLTCVIDSSGAYIPGHGTPTVVILARNRNPVAVTVRTVQGVRGEPDQPDDPARGRVWTEIVENISHPGFDGTYISVRDVPRARFSKHPWSLGGGGAAELKETLDAARDRPLSVEVKEIGFGAVTREDLLFVASTDVARRWGVPEAQIRPMVEGESVRDWCISSPQGALWPYDPVSLECLDSGAVQRSLWPWKRQLSERVAYGKSQIERGLAWYEYSMFFRERFRTPLSIAYAEIATHNHFVLARGGMVFKQTAPLIMLAPEATEDDHLALLGVLNSSTACFWIKEVFYAKGGDHIGAEGARVPGLRWEERYQLDGSKLRALPIPRRSLLRPARACQQAADAWALFEPASLLDSGLPGRDALRAAEREEEAARALLVFLQEELDWHAYRAFELTDEDLTWAGEPVPILPGERAFELRLARGDAPGEASDEWFVRHGITPREGPPDHWPPQYASLVRRRMRASGTVPALRLIERPEFKRRWSSSSWARRMSYALRDWLLRRMEEHSDWSDGRLASCMRWTTSLRSDPEFMSVASLFRNGADFDLTRLVVELVKAESVPYLPALRYKSPGIRKRAEWERVWDAQRRSDAGEGLSAVSAQDDHQLSATRPAALRRHGDGAVPLPPSYKASDFRQQTYWRLRGKLDVPKERFIIYPGAERDTDPTPVIGWAGWDHLERATALAAYYVDMRDSEGWDGDRLTPLLAGLLDLLPWLKQWHDDPDPTFGVGMGQYFDDFLSEELRRHGLTREDLRSWRPPTRSRGGRRKRPS